MRPPSTPGYRRRQSPSCPPHPQGLTYEVRNNIDRKQILKLLDGVTGYIRAGEMVSLMGPSGSGKTTLLDVLAGRKTVGKATGTVLFDGQRPTRAFLRRYTGYVEQFDTLIGNMTVREMLQYTVELKSPMAEPAASKAARVARALDQLSLETCADVLVGTPANRGISGGQLKRANIGLALVASPKVLFLDEPTTGLDSFTAGEVIDAVRQLTTSAGITVIATIHSPPQRVFSTFDRIMVLLGGRTVHFGPASAALGGGPNSGLGPLAAIAGGGVPLRETGLSDSEWLMDVVVEADRKGEGVQLADKYAASALAKAAEREVDELLEASTARNKLKSKASAKEPVCKQVASAASLSRWRSSGLDRQESTAAGKESDRHVTQVRRSTEVPAYYGLWTMIKHRLKVDYRDPAFMGPRIMDKIVVNLIICTLYLHAGDNMSMSNIPNIVACIFMVSP